MEAESVEVTRRRREHPSHEISRIPGARTGIEQSRLRQQIIELQKELSRVVPRRVKRKRLGENSLEGLVTSRNFEPNFSGVKREGESESQLESLDSELESWIATARRSLPLLPIARRPAVP